MGKKSRCGLQAAFAAPPCRCPGHVAEATGVGCLPTPLRRDQAGCDTAAAAGLLLWLVGDGPTARSGARKAASRHIDIKKVAVPSIRVSTNARKTSASAMPHR